MGDERYGDKLVSHLTPLEFIEKHLNGEIIMDEDLKHYCLFSLKENLEELEKLKDNNWPLL